MGMNVPILEGTPRSDGHGLKVYCEHCQKWHLHVHGDGHRTSDCENENSPYLKTGYVIKSKSDELLGEMTQSLKPVQRFTEYVRQHGVSFFNPDTWHIAERARSGPMFQLKDIPAYVGNDHREMIAELLNGVVEHYEKKRKARWQYQISIEDMKQQIPRIERDNLKIANDWSFYLDDRHDKWLAKMSVKAAVKEWFSMSQEEKQRWFDKVLKHINERHTETLRNAEHICLQLGKKWAYDTLGIPQSADKEVIRKAWRELTRMIRNNDPQRLSQVQRAYETLIFTA